MNTHLATLRLFNAVQVSDGKKPQEYPQAFTHSFQQGYVLDPRITPTAAVLQACDQILGFDGIKANATFHKSWAVVRDTPMSVLVMQQIMHYFTTYGLEHLGVYREDLVYIPHEHLDAPGITETFPLVVVKAMTATELLDEIKALAGSGIALSEQTLADIMTLVKVNEYGSGIVNYVKNRELSALLAQYYDLAPQEPVEFLRYMVTKLTGQSLLIKNRDLVQQLEQARAGEIDALMRKAPHDLGSIFYRFKPLFLAMRRATTNKRPFNRLRRAAETQHRPVVQDYASTLTSTIKKYGRFDNEKLADALSRINTFRKVRLLYALSYRLVSPRSIVYRVRNGRGWATEFEWSKYTMDTTRESYTMVLKSIVDAIRPQVEGKSFYIPAGIAYALPATEKQFVGNIPVGTSVIVPEDMIFGVHWYDCSDRRVDLDLSVVNESGKIGWDSRYRTGDRQVMFSGDVTSAPKPNGATELFYMATTKEDEARLVYLNYYNFSADHPVDTRILVAQKPASVRLHKNYMVDPNYIVCQATVNVDKKSSIVGLVHKNKFFFTYMGVGNRITSSNDENAQHTRRYLVDRLASSIDFAGVMVLAGARLVLDPKEADFDLSPETLDKTTFIKILS